MAFVARVVAALSVALAPAIACVDLFHSTRWEAPCDAPGSPACAGSGATGTAGGGGTGGGAEGGGGTGGEGGSPPGPCTPGEVVACYSGPARTQNVGACADGERACDERGVLGPCVGEVLPTAEVCGNGEDEDCSGSATEGCLFASCTDVPATGVYPIDPNGGDPSDAIELHCDMDTDGGGWAMLLNSIGSGAGTTLAFWQIAYADRLAYKGKPFLYDNFYAGILYTVATEYRDEIEDQNGAVVQAVRADAAGFDPMTMAFQLPVLVAGHQSVFDCHFAAGWSSADLDGDPYVDGNCAALYAGVTQHYCSCWNYNLGADADAPYDDAGWGPHLAASVAADLGLGSDGSGYTRVSRITRWARF